MTGNRRIFDAHTHAFPDFIAQRAVTSLAAQGGVTPHHDGTIAGVRAYEAAGGACGFLVLPIATKPSQTRSVNEWAAGIMGDGCYAFGSIHPDSAHWQEELDRIVDLGLKGVKLHPEYQEFFVDEERMLPIYEAIFARDLPVCFHAGVDIGFHRPLRGGAEGIGRVSEAFPEGKIIAAHMGGFRQLETVKECLAGKRNVWMDTSFAVNEMTSQEIRELIFLHGSDRFMFATDAPWTAFDTGVQALLSAGLEEEVLEDIFYKNAAGLLGMDAE